MSCMYSIFFWRRSYFLPSASWSVGSFLVVLTNLFRYSLITPSGTLSGGKVLSTSSFVTGFTFFLNPVNLKP